MLNTQLWGYMPHKYVRLMWDKYIRLMQGFFLSLYFVKEIIDIFKKYLFIYSFIFVRQDDREGENRLPSVDSLPE